MSAILQKNMPEKCKDPGMFSLPCVIGEKKVEHAMLHLGASINVMPFSVYQELKLNDLQKTGVVIQLADRSYIHPLGIVEDVLVQVNELIFPVDFYILEMEGNHSSKSTSILLGRPFMKTAKTKIDVDEGILSVEFDGEIVKFNIFDAVKHPTDVHSLCQEHSVFSLDAINPIVQEVFFMDEEGKQRKLQPQELKEIRNKSYESSRFYKEKTKAFHDKMVLRKEFSVVEIRSPTFEKVLKVNGHRLKPFYEGFSVNIVKEVALESPMYRD